MRQFGLLMDFEEDIPHTFQLPSRCPADLGHALLQRVILQRQVLGADVFSDRFFVVIWWRLTSPFLDVGVDSLHAATRSCRVVPYFTGSFNTFLSLWAEHIFLLERKGHCCLRDKLSRFTRVISLIYSWYFVFHWYSKIWRLLGELCFEELSPRILTWVIDLRITHI